MSRKEKYPHTDSFDPSFCISRKLMKCNRIVSAIFRRYYLPFGLTNSQVSILFVLAKKKRATQTELADFLSLEKSTVSRNMQRLFQNGYLDKESLKEIKLTKKGQALLEQIIPEWDKAMAEARTKLKKEGEQALNIILGNLTK